MAGERTRQATWTRLIAGILRPTPEALLGLVNVGVLVAQREFDCLDVSARISSVLRRAVTSAMSLSRRQALSLRLASPDQINTARRVRTAMVPPIAGISA